MTTYYKHLLRTGMLDLEEIVTNAKGRKISHVEFLEEFCRD